MATQKRPAHSGFEAPTIGVVYPKGSTIKRMPDGTVKVIKPKAKKTGSKKK